MHVLYCASEGAPIVKIGGLGDVAGSLPKALQDLGITTTLVIPHYQIIDNQKWQIEPVGEIVVPFGVNQESIPVTVSKTHLPNSSVTVILLYDATYIAGGGANAFEGSVSESQRFAFFSKAITELLYAENMRELVGMPDVIHLNDWHTCPVPLLVKQRQKQMPASTYNPAFVLTIHNLAYQGITDLSILDTLHLDPKDDEGVKWDAANNDVDMLLEGIIHVDAINTVSVNYAKEILTKEFCEGLCEILQRRQDRLFGILNGIDYATWSPQTDSFVTRTYGQSDLESGKAENKQHLQSRLGLAVKAEVPVVGFIGRVEPIQKGIDLCYDWLQSLEAQAKTGGAVPVQFVLLGTGDKAWEAKLTDLKQGNEQWLSINLLFDETLAHMMYAGCDYIIMPSKFEPGGLPQMIAQHYGTVPIVHAVGGLKDTVQDGQTGFTFAEYASTALANSVKRALKEYNAPAYWQMARVGMEQDYSWAASAKKYQAFYEQALTLRGQ